MNPASFNSILELLHHSLHGLPCNQSNKECLLETLLLQYSDVACEDLNLHLFEPVPPLRVIEAALFLVDL